MDDALYQEMFDLEMQFWWFRAKRSIIRSLIERYLVPRAGQRPTVCDIGCGCGAMLSDLSDQYHTVGVERSPVARGFAARRSIDVREGGLPRDLPFAEQTFDVVVLSDVLEHVEDDQASVESVARLLRPGGVLVCTVPACPWLWTGRDALHHHYRRYTCRGFKGLFQNQPLERKVLSYYNSILFPPIAVIRLVSKTVYRDNAAPDIRLPPSWLNETLTRVFGLERHLLPCLTLPIGISLISVHIRR